MWMVLVAGLAQATEVGTTARDGVGLSLGAPSFAFTYKHFFTEKHALAAYLGRSPKWIPLDARVEYNGELAQMHDWVWGRLALIWEGGVELGLTDRYGLIGTRMGVIGGLGATLSLHDYPLEVFTDLSIGIYPLNTNCYDSLRSPSSCLVGRVDVDRFPSPLRVGARWYF